MPDRRPNILIVMSDHETAEALRPGSACPTPHADRLAREGLRFSHAYTCTAHCCPSRATFMSGLYPSRHGIWNNVLNEQALGVSLADGVRLFSEDLAEAGYRMIYTGKWHVCADENPEDRGWQARQAVATREGYHGATYAQWRQRAATQSAEPPERQRGQVLCPGYGTYTLYGSRENGGPKGYEDDMDYTYTAEGVKAIHELKDADAPWCLFVGFVGPHDPYVVPEKYAARVDPASVALPPSYSDRMDDKPAIYRRQRRDRWDQLSESEVREAIAHFYGYCAMLDDLFGELLDALDATGQADNTLVVRTADHGDYAGAHGLFCKGVPAFDEAYRVPLIARWPRGLANPGRVVDAFAGLHDMAPTFLEAAGVDGGRPMSGRSLMPWLRGESPADWPDTRFTQFNGVELYYHQRAVQTHRWKYVFNGFDFDELYDLENDPHEMVNLAGRPGMQPVIHDMCRRYWPMACRENDPMAMNYITVSLMPLGPADCLKPL